VPALGESITEGTIQKWMKNVHDHISVGDVVAVIETDKVTVDIKSTMAGVLVEKLANDIVSCSITVCIKSITFICIINM
jgi:Biotin-requiring enzyme